MNRRERRYRVWDDVLKEYTFTGFHFFGEVLTFDMIGMRIADTMDKRPHLDGHSIMGTNDFYVEDWTGLVDSAGIDAYENDIVKLPSSEIPMVIQWDAAHAQFALFQVGRLKDLGSGWGVQNSQRYTIIGNVRQNQELLK